MSAPLAVERREPETSPPPPRRRSGLWVVTLVMAAAVGAAFYTGLLSRAKIQAAWNTLNQDVEKIHEKPEPHDPPEAVVKQSENRPWDGLVTVGDEELTSLGIHAVEVKAQTNPIRLELTGRTAYDTNTITKVRPRFDTRVEKVFASIGEKVKKGAPLVELYSTDLAAAKTDFQTKYVQWQHDLNLYKLRQKLVETGAISQQLWVDTQNDEQKSRLDFNISRDKLTVFYEIPESEINPLLEKISDKAIDTARFGSVTDKAKMVLKAKHDGYVITREVVPGNFYESTDVLMEIAPLDHLWVWVNVYELDQDKVRVGQTIDIQFPFLEEGTVEGHIDYVASEVSKDTRAVRVRASIRNPDARLKSDMLLRAYLEIPPVPGQTVIPRQSMVALSGGEYAFVRLPREGQKEGADRFERVKIRVAQENTDHVIVAEGLKPGQQVVTNGSLILAQLYEDQRMTTTGLPPQ